MTTHRRAALVALLSAGTGAVAAVPPLVLRTASEAGVPHKFGRPGAASAGFCVDYARALSALDAGLRFEGLDQFLPVLRIERELAAGTLDVFFGLLKNPDRLARFRFIDQPPLYMSRHRAVVRAQDHEVDSLRGFDDIRRLGDRGVVLATRGTAYASYLHRQGGLKVDDGATDHRQNLLKLLRGRGRFFYQSEGVLRQLVQDPGAQDKVRILPVVFAEQPLLVAYAAALDAGHVARLAQAMNELEADGTAARLRAVHDL